jgi:hypothetical protein
LIAWNLQSQGARAEEEPQAGNSVPYIAPSYLMRLQSVEPESGDANQIQEFEVTIDGVSTDIQLIIEVFSNSTSPGTLGFPESAESMSVSYTAIATLRVWNGTEWEGVAELERNISGECGLVTTSWTDLTASTTDETSSDEMVLPVLNHTSIQFNEDGAVYTFTLEFDHLGSYPGGTNQTYVTAKAKLQGTGVNASTDERGVIHTFESFKSN